MIITANPDRILNKRSELISKCRHENKFYLRNNLLKNNTLLAFFSHLVFSHFINNKLKSVLSTVLAALATLSHVHVSSFIVEGKSQFLS